MPRYFLELCYDGSRFSGFQVQENANTIQAEVEKAISVLLRSSIDLTGSSRTDAGVHALQNYFHFNHELPLPEGFVYHVNAILPPQIAIVSCLQVGNKSHCRFDASGRWYRYKLNNRKDPFEIKRAWYYPYPLDREKLDAAAAMVISNTDFTAFAKRHADAKTNICSVFRSEWKQTEHGWEYEVEANRFLRGMVRGLVSTMLQVGRNKISIEAFHEILRSNDNQKTHFTAPGHGLYLVKVKFPEGYFSSSIPED